MRVGGPCGVLGAKPVRPPKYSPHRATVPRTASPPETIVGAVTCAAAIAVPVYSTVSPRAMIRRRQLRIDHCGSNRSGVHVDLTRSDAR